MSTVRSEEFEARNAPGEDLFAPTLAPVREEAVPPKRLARGLGISLRRPGRPSTPPPPQADDAFATLIVPMPAGDIDRLRRGLEQDVCLYDRFEIARNRLVTAHMGGAAIAAAIAVSLALAWGQWALDLRDMVPPAWLVDAIDLSNARTAMFVLGVLLAVGWLGFIALAGADVLRAIGERHFAPFLLAIIELTFIFPAGLALFALHLPLTAILLVSGFLVSRVVRFFIDRRMRL